MASFKAMVKQSTAQLATDTEQERSRLLNSYLQKRLKKQSEFSTLVRKLDETAEKVNVDLNKLKIAKTSTSYNEKFAYVKDTVRKLTVSENGRKEELAML